MSLKIFMVLVACLASLSAQAQEAAWPTKPIKLVVPYTPGGGTDILGRMLGRRLSDSLGVAVVIENRPGAGPPPAPPSDRFVRPVRCLTPALAMFRASPETRLFGGGQFAVRDEVERSRGRQFAVLSCVRP